MAASIGDSGPYSGEVAPGGPPDTRELAGLIVTKLAVDKEMSNNCYLLRCRATDEQVLIDAAAEPDNLRQLVGLVGADQGDHHPPALGPPPRARGRRRRDRSRHRGRPARRGRDHRADRGGRSTTRSSTGDTIEFGDVVLQVIHLVGHTPGSIALLYDDPGGTPHLWTGDSLFPGGVGNTFGDKDAFTSLLDDVSLEDLRPPPRRDLVLPGPRQRLGPRQRAPPPRGVARTRLVRCRARRRWRFASHLPICHVVRSWLGDDSAAS